MATCKFCGAEIKWVQQKNRQWIALNPIDNTIHDRSNGSCERRYPSRVIFHKAKSRSMFKTGFVPLCNQSYTGFPGKLNVTNKDNKVTCKKCLKKMKKIKWKCNNYMCMMHTRNNFCKASNSYRERQSKQRGSNCSPQKVELPYEEE
jgi:hypothetical protein